MIPQQGLLQPQGQPQEAQQQPAPTQGMPQQQQAPQQAPMGHPQEGQQRDYKANPLNDAEDRDQFDKMVIQATKLIHAPQSRDKVLGRIGGKAHPYKDIASAAVTVMNRIDQQFAKEQEQPDPAVRMLALAETAKQIVDLAVAAGKLPEAPPDNDMKIILAQAVQNDQKNLLAGGKVSKEALSEGVQQSTSSILKMQGGEGGSAEFDAQTEALKNRGMTSSSPAQAKLMGSEPPTMTEVLRNRGGLKNG